MAFKSLKKIVAASVLALSVVFNGAAGAADPVITPQVGAKMADGSVYAGVSPETNKSMYTTPADAPTLHTWKSAMTYCGTLEASGHKDWRLPTDAELDVLYENKKSGALKGTFNLTGRGLAGWYVSSAHYLDVNTYGQRFSDGRLDSYGMKYDSSVRCVRTVPRQP